MGRRRLPDASLASALMLASITSAFRSQTARPRRPASDPSRRVGDFFCRDQFRRRLLPEVGLVASSDHASITDRRCQKPESGDDGRATTTTTRTALLLRHSFTRAHTRSKMLGRVLVALSSLALLHSVYAAWSGASLQSSTLLVDAGLVARANRWSTSSPDRCQIRRYRTRTETGHSGPDGGKSLPQTSGDKRSALQKLILARFALAGRGRSNRIFRLARHRYSVDGPTAQRRHFR